MVDIVLLQSLSYVAAAIGVCVAAFYYAMSLREANKNRRVTLASNLMQTFISEEGSRRWIDLIQMEWKDFDDYMKKFDSTVNPNNFAKRNAVWNTCDVLGYLYESKIIEMETIFAISGPAVYRTWIKFKPILEEYRRRGEHEPLQYKHWEYLASEMSKWMEQKRRESTS